MHRLRLRHLTLTIALGLVLSMVVAPQAFGVTRGTNTLNDPNGHPWHQVGLWGGGAYFLSTYDVVHMQDFGRTWWAITKFETTGVVEGGGNCLQCEGFSFTSQIQFLSATNAVLGTYNPPLGACYSHIGNASWVFISRCQQAYQITGSATKIRYTFTMFVGCTCGGVSHWDVVTKTTPIV